jgi:hypothetical protein
MLDLDKFFLLLFWLLLLLLVRLLDLLLLFLRGNSMCPAVAVDLNAAAAASVGYPCRFSSCLAAALLLMFP